ncbi:MAG: DUF3426 domain-containing protein [Pseudohongiella sp.]|nr:DUF3426 domain-containing protein [Pseudohongiella sp.]MDP2284760.1 DUF3426 domain-containing protein [Pseudohongiella sp.]
MWTILESSSEKTAHLPEFDEPLILGETAPAPTSWWLIVVSLVGILLLSASFVAQLVYFNRDTLLRDPRARSALESVCARLACELPIVRDASLLRSVFLDVSSHPEYESMLLVQFRVKNTAPFAMPYPSAELSFRNIQNQIVAARRFYPGHYLEVSLLPLLMIPAGAEIQGKLELLDPGTESVNYTLEFVYEHQ